ncbi:DUF4238 domain-containing protein [Colwellia sp. E2M01]|uniref:DUF4238 domain-containing protein n=1 Tax=Colwellia sp. E2M01 TaxID=2841561 RepID=UPI001C08DD89|nr:DUF4238 domain-containing protein [Colwellia sp. E2M01]MBU2872006.1 DUF4238 domain-containing protein [Colwellia sp. E2M01]
MSKSTNKNHFSPVFANKHWTSGNENWHYKYYYFCQNRNCVVDGKKDKGKTAWGFEFNLYSQELEDKLDTELENHASLLYEKLLSDIVLTPDERMKWSQYIITQAVRTPSFFKYRDKLEEINGGDTSYKENIIGCQWCDENKYIANRNWLILEAAEDDYFMRTDNPVYMTGFINNPTTTIYYPLSPKKCFVACSALDKIYLPKGMNIPNPKQEVHKLSKGDTFKINFDIVRSASNSLIVAKSNNNRSTSHMNLQLLGVFPQIPFMLSMANNDMAELNEMNKIIELMSVTDNMDYPSYREYELKPFYGVEFSMGINPFSVFGVTDEKLLEQYPDLEI